MSRLPRNQFLVGDVRRLVAELPAKSVDCVVTSPPFFLLRDYQVAGQMGLEETVEDWVSELRTVFAGLARVLKPTGSVWLNLGDSFSRHHRYGAPAKSLLLGPERLALALLEDGWTVRNKIVWAKSNTMPTSVRDRLAAKHEVVYFLTRSQQYWFDLDAIRVPHRSTAGRHHVAVPRTRPVWAGPLAGSNSGLAKLKGAGRVGHRLGANPGDVWVTAASNYRGAHFATFPPTLVVRPLLATCPERVCMACGRPWRRLPPRDVGESFVRGEQVADCNCGAGFRSGVVLDPFAGAGTVPLVADQHRRDWVGIELNPEFVRLARKRITADRKQRGGTAHAR